MKNNFAPETLLAPCPVWCIGSYDKKGKPNVMTASWTGICCSKPPAVTVSLRKATYTYTSIMETGAYTISVPSEKYAGEADYFGMVSGKREDKFEATGLTPVKADKVNAPYVDEFPWVLECRVIHTLEIGLHTQFIGEIMNIKADETILGENGRPDLLKLAPFLYDTGSSTYCSVGEQLGQAFSIGKPFINK